MEKNEIKKDYIFSLIMCIAMPVIWILLYLAGQIGKKIGYTQMNKFHFILKKQAKKIRFILYQNSFSNNIDAISFCNSFDFSLAFFAKSLSEEA